MFIPMCRVFFCKKTTAYEWRISDCSSDVCSSDLVIIGREDLLLHAIARQADLPEPLIAIGIERGVDPFPANGEHAGGGASEIPDQAAPIGRHHHGVPGKTVIKALLVVNCEARGLLVMAWAARLQRAAGAGVLHPAVYQRGKRRE